MEILKIENLNKIYGIGDNLKLRFSPILMN